MISRHLLISVRCWVMPFGDVGLKCCFLCDVLVAGVVSCGAGVVADYYYSGDQQLAGSGVCASQQLSMSTH